MESIETGRDPNPRYWAFQGIRMRYDEFADPHGALYRSERVLVSAYKPLVLLDAEFGNYHYILFPIPCGSAPGRYADRERAPRCWARTY